jgi:hypothetical protein
MSKADLEEQNYSIQLERQTLLEQLVSEAKMFGPLAFRGLYKISLIDCWAKVLSIKVKA